MRRPYLQDKHHLRNAVTCQHGAVPSLYGLLDFDMAVQSAWLTTAVLIREPVRRAAGQCFYRPSDLLVWNAKHCLLNPDPPPSTSDHSQKPILDCLLQMMFRWYQVTLLDAVMRTLSFDGDRLTSRERCENVMVDP